MPFRQYTKCYTHTAGDKPFNKSDLLWFVAGASAPGVGAAVAAFLLGDIAIGYVIIAIQYAATIVAVANEWLYHRLVCLTGNRCAVGKVETLEAPSTLGDFDNDVYFDLRLMPHRHGDEYKAPNTSYLGSVDSMGNLIPPGPGPAIDPLTIAHPANDIFLDGFQGTDLVKPIFANNPPDPVDLPYDHVPSEETPLGGELPRVLLSRSTLHCEAEGNFWQAMKDYVALQGAATATGAAAGAAAGCALGSYFGPIGCLIGGFLGALAGGGAAAAAGAYAAFNSNPGDFNDANVGDTPIPSVAKDDRIVVFGTHVYDGFHEGWHEIHPIMAILRFNDLNIQGAIQYLEWDPNFPDGAETPAGLTVADMRAGLNSGAFRAAAQKVRDQWCAAIGQPFAPGVANAQALPENRWTIHPAVDGCQPAASPPPR